MSISSIGNTNQNNISAIMQKLISGNKINSAADNAAGLAISEKILSQTNGYDVGTRNAQDGKNMINVAEGGLSGISDSLGRIRELALQSKNGIYSNEDKANIQAEVQQLKETISDQAKGTQFNNIKLLDGSKANIDLATNPQANGMSIQTVNGTLDSLGIADLDVTGDFSLDTIDNAIDKVSSARAILGAGSNRLEHTININTNTNINLTNAYSRIKDTDYAEQTSRLKTEQVLEQYKYFAQAQQSRAKSGLLSLFD